MAIVTHEIAPDGDTIIVVKNPNAPFVPYPSPSSTMPSTSSKSADNANNANNADNAIDEDKSCPEVRIRVSSAHLKFASPFFKRALSGDWKEAQTLRETGSVEIETSDWDIEALLLLMRILHCKLSQLPKGVDIERLAKLLVLVDYYEYNDLLGFIGERWPTQLYTFQNIRVTTIRFWVAWTLKHSEGFSHCATMLVRHADGPIITLGLPIPSSIIDDLNERRENALSSSIYLIKAQKNVWKSQDRLCHKLCKYVCHGALKDFITAKKLSGAEAPYQGLSLHDLQAALADLKPPQFREWTKDKTDPDSPIKPHECKHTKFSQLRSAVASKDIKGVELSELKSSITKAKPVVANKD